MDGRQFDAMTRALARGATRRTALKGLIAGLASGLAVTTRLDRAGAQVECESNDNCRGGGFCCNGVCAECCTADDCDPYVEDQCGVRVCTGGYCTPATTCTTAERCCNSGTPDHYCATCCGDQDCPGCAVCGNDGQCSTPECCSDAECNNACKTCTGGVCTTRDCPAGEACCSFTGECQSTALCCLDVDCPCGYCSGGTCYSECPQDELCCDDTCKECCGDADCGACETCVEGECLGACSQSQQCCNDHCIALSACCTTDDCPPCSHCSEGTCLGECSQSQECCHDECVAIGTCCQHATETCLVTDGPGSQGNCCDNLRCCSTGSGGVCAECCNDDDCGRCRSCESGVCALEPGCCISSHGSCSVVTIAGSDTAPECCDGLVCCDIGNHEYVCRECCSNADCHPGGHCSDGVCTYPGCRHDHDCPEGTCCCHDGTCSHSCCHHKPPKPPTPPTPPPPTQPVSSLPATGAGEPPESTGLLGAALLGAAAYLGARKLREPAGEPGEE